MKKYEGIKVSVIVPIYNVDKYLEKCINSITLQNHKNIEIILIDDGSTDNSLNICNKCAKEDDRIIVIHQENSGVSTARNKGIEKFTGEYLTFVDSDDYLASDFIEYMLSLVVDNGCEFGLSKNCYKYSSDSQEENDRIEVIDKSEATALLLSQRVDVGCWNKIYERKLIIENNIKFLTTQFYGEGLQFITKVSQMASKTCVGLRRVYYYRQNNFSSATKKFNYNKYVNGEKSLDIIRDNLVVHSANVERQLEIHYCLFYMNALNDLLVNRKKKQYIESYRYWRICIKKLAKKVFKYKEMSKKQKLRFIIIYYFPDILAIRTKIKKKYLKRKSVD